MIKILKHPLFLAVLILALVNIVLFWQFYFKGLLPFPGNLLVSYYFPWNGGGFAGFDPWTTRKDVIAMDVIRTMYPWKSLVMDQLKAGQWPLWNPYNFSGTPLLANIQSAVFFPANLIFFLLPLLPAWIFLVLALPLAFSIFWYFFFKSLKLSPVSAILGSIFAANITYLNVWTEQLVLLQSILFLPLILWATNRFAQTKKTIFLFPIPLFLAFSFFGGHPQTTLYVFIISGLYFLVQRIPLKPIILIYAFAAAISAVQLFPTLELYRYSARENPALRESIRATTLPWSNLATIFAPDYFGNPATNNFRKNNYDNSLAYSGIVALTLAAMVIALRHRPRHVNFFLLLAVFGLVFALSPAALIFSYLHIPILSTGFLSRNVFFFELSIAILAAIGLDGLIKSKTRATGIFIPIAIILFSYAILTIAALFFPPPARSVSLKNLILPGAVFAASAVAIVTLKTKLKTISVIALICLAILEYGYFFNKYQPFAPAKFVFPNHPVFSFLQSTGFDRYFGVDRAYIDNNFATFYRVYAPEGYDPLFIRRYGELLTASNDGKFPKSIPSSDAFVGQFNNDYRQRLFDLLAVKYLVDKTDDPAKDWGPNLEKFPEARFEFIKQYSKWKFYERKTVLPRAFLAENYQLQTNPKKIIEQLYAQDFSPQTTLLLETEPEIKPVSGGKGLARITNYTPNRVIIETEADQPKLLFLSDNYYPGWQVWVDDQPAEILRADYTFRAVPLPAGNHTVRFEYHPLSFKLGLLISLASLLLIFILIFHQRKIYA